MNFVFVFNGSACLSLHQNVSDGSCFYGSGNDRNTQSFLCQSVQQLILASAADDV